VYLDVGLRGRGAAGTGPFTAGYGGAATPVASNGSPQGPTTIGQKAYGIVTGSTGGGRTAHVALVGGGLFALGALIWIWWSLPR
jgi:hypothetical protein